MVMKDPLVGALPEQTNTASQPLTGLPQSMTGGVGTSLVPPQTGQPGLAPVPPPGNSAQVGGRPLSGNDANMPQGGAGADIDLVKDRGTPDQFIRKAALEVGSEKGAGSVGEIAAASRTGEGMSQEDINRQGTRANKALGMDTPEKAKAVVDGAVITPLAETISSEIKSEDIDPTTGLERISQVILNVNGAEDEKAVEKAVDEGAGKIGETNKSRIKDMKASMIKWWKKGKNNPDEQVTGFMGGMNRQELGMFVFQWGAMMMANSSEGFGPAMGAASLGALQGHQGRKATETAAEQQEFENKLGQQKADAGTKTADAAMKRADAYVKQASLGGSSNLKDAFLIDFYRTQGKSDKWITERIAGAKSETQVFDIVSEDVGQMVAKAKADPPFTDDEAVMIDYDDNPATPAVALHKMTPKQEAAYARIITEERLKARGSLGSGALPAETSSVSDKYRD